MYAKLMLATLVWEPNGYRFRRWGILLKVGVYGHPKNRVLNASLAQAG